MQNPLETNMTEYICSLTNQPTTDPVVSTRSGHIFDKYAIEKHLDSELICPITNKPLTPNDLVPLTGIFLYKKFLAYFSSQRAFKGEEKCRF